ncbi:MAG: WD40/YVTN/BNR-like repeat-containing protein, partial [Saprospiraceae bacterium]
MQISRFLLLFGTLCLFISSTSVLAQAEEGSKKESKPWSASTFKGLKLRSIGPAFYTGRIADVAINPEDESEWYVAVGSGGIWKTENAGTTFMPVFDDQKVYSTGCVTIDPNNTKRVWVGSGENSGGRHFSWGDGIYLSENSGKKWKNMGLKRSEHISKIVVHPSNSDVVWVASQGPLWSKGGQRGIYMTVDGGKTWKRTLGNDEWTGATDLLIDPRNPKRLYAATWDRHRTVAAYMGGGPGSGIHMSEDGGLTWKELKGGLPKVNMGKIGLAISPQNPDVLYAAIELEQKEGGVYRSENRGASWTKMSDLIAGGTGPHYYQELYPSPHAFDRIYFSNNYLKVSNDGGKTWEGVKNKGKHVDNHAMAFKKNDPDYLMVATDGGLYESYDMAENWRFFGNMPISQFYKIALDDAEPFYNIYGGTQDNSSQGGPSRTDNTTGIQNGDWQIVNGGDGHQPATEPGNPNIIYAQSQQGYLNRIDMVTGDRVSIRPQPAAGESYERYNWDAPIYVSPHSPKRLYFASQRLWRSEDRGDNWTAISKDLTRDDNRLSLPIMGRKQSYDNPWDVYAMSNFSTITSISESPIEEDRLYVGTDDGLIWTTTDAGANWNKKEVGSISGVPARAFVNDIKADLHDAKTAYVAMDNHKEGDYRPMLYKTTDGGSTWRSITKGLPDTTLVWRIVQDHVNPDLMFLGTEFGLYFSVDRGAEWMQLKGGVPTISFRDLAIQKRENDLVCATFGRSIYVLDDYSALRAIDKNLLQQEAALLPMRDADLFQPRNVLTNGGRGSIGTGHYAAKNPEFGAVFTYYLKDEYKSTKAKRKEAEKKLNKAGSDIPFPGYDAMEVERLEKSPLVWLTVSDDAGNVVRRIEAPAKKGIQRIAWDLRHSSMLPVRESKGGRGDKGRPSGRWALPGSYQASLSKMHNGVETQLGEPIKFDVKRLREGSIAGATPAVASAFAKTFEQARSDQRMQGKRFGELQKEVKNMHESILRSEEKSIGSVLPTIVKLESDIEAMKVTLYGQPSR